MNTKEAAATVTLKNLVSLLFFFFCLLLFFLQFLCLDGFYFRDDKDECLCLKQHEKGNQH